MQASLKRLKGTFSRRILIEQLRLDLEAAACRLPAAIEEAVPA